MNQRPDVVGMDDVHFDVNRRLGLLDRACPGRVVLSRVTQDGDSIARDERRAGGPAERLVGELLQRRSVVTRCDPRPVEHNGHPPTIIVR